MNKEYYLSEAINLKKRSDEVTGHYENFILSQVNNSCLRMSVNHGLYDWHVHNNSDELFIVVEGELQIETTDGQVCKLRPLDYLKIPKSVAHRTRSEIRTVNLTFESLDLHSEFLTNPVHRGAKHELIVKNLKKEADQITESYKNVVLEKVNDHVMRLGINHGIYDWHCHPNSDELFLGIENKVHIEIEGNSPVEIRPFEIYTVPKNINHRTSTRDRKVSVTFEADSTSTIVLKNGK